MSTLIEEKRVHEKVRQFDFVITEDKTFDFESYDLEQTDVKRFIMTCQKAKENAEDKDIINPFPILHQLYRGIFLLRHANYKTGLVKTLIEYSRLLSKTLPHLFPLVHTVFF